MSQQSKNKGLKPRISIITLAVDNLERSLNFYRDGLGLPTQGITDDHVAFFLEGDLAFVLYPRAEIAKIAKQAETKPSSAECILSYTADNEEEVKEILKRAEAAGATLPDKVEKQAWGGYSGHFLDPDGHLWQVMC
jgi:uncharacterized protein